MIEAIAAAVCSGDCPLVQIAHSPSDSRDIEHYGSAHDVVELVAAEALASTGSSASTGIAALAGV